MQDRTPTVQPGTGSSPPRSFTLNLTVVHCGKCTINNQLPVYPLFPISSLASCGVSTAVKNENTQKRHCCMSVFYTYFIYYFCLRGSEGGFLILEQYKVVRIRFSCPVKLKTSTPYLLQHPYSHQHCSVWISNSSTDLPVKGHCTGQVQGAWPRITSSVGHFTVVAKLSQVCITA